MINFNTFRICQKEKKNLYPTIITINLSIGKLKIISKTAKLHMTFSKQEQKKKKTRISSIKNLMQQRKIDNFIPNERKINQK